MMEHIPAEDGDDEGDAPEQDTHGLQRSHGRDQVPRGQYFGQADQIDQIDQIDQAGHQEAPSTPGGKQQDGWVIRLIGGVMSFFLDVILDWIVGLFTGN